MDPSEYQDHFQKQAEKETMQNTNKNSAPTQPIRLPKPCTRENLNAMVLKHEQQIKDIASHLLEIKQSITPMMEFKRREWVGLTGDEIEDLPKGGTWWEAIKAAEAILREKNCG